MMRKSILAAALAATAALGTGIAQAVPAVVAPAAPAHAFVLPAPPAPLAESVPAPRAGLVWAPGHYAVHNGGYVWVHGHWMPERPGYAWMEPRWMQRADGTWSLIGGHWVQGGNDLYTYIDGDRDADGIANAFDNDRDGDGVLNRNDAYAGNRYFR